MFGRFIWDRTQQRLIPSDQYYAQKAQGVAVSPLPFPMVISDQIELQGQHDGRMYTSKSALRKSYRQNGYVEVGNEWLNNEPKQPKRKPDRKGIRNAIGKAKQRAGL